MAHQQIKVLGLINIQLMILMSDMITIMNQFILSIFVNEFFNIGLKNLKLMGSDWIYQKDILKIKPSEILMLGVLMTNLE